MKAILFSNFPKDFFNETLKPKFDMHNVEIVRVANIDRSPIIAPGEADVVIAMVELMSIGQRTKVKELARKYNKRFIGLQRKGAGADWAIKLATAAKEIEDGKPLPPSVAPASQRTWAPHVVPLAVPWPPPSEEAEEVVENEVSPEELKDMLNLFEQENEKLEEKVRSLSKQIKGYEETVGRATALPNQNVESLKTTLEKTKLERDQQAAEVRKLKKLNDGYVDSFARNATDQGRHAAELEDLRGRFDEAQKYVVNAQKEVTTAANTSAMLKTELADTNRLAKKQAEELFKLREENERLRKTPAPIDTIASLELTKKVRDLKEENEVLRKRTTLKTTEDFLKVREAFATLWRAGVMNDRDILEKLMNWQPKEG